MKQVERLLFGLFVLSICPAALMALPTVSEVVSGEALFSYDEANTLVIQAKDHTIIQHETFSIGEGEKVRYIQPNESSVVLSRVIGKDPSILLGELTSNGKVFLVNPNGVYFGKDAVVDVGSLVVSTLTLRDEDFIRGNYFFSSEQASGEIVNLGNIQANESIAFLSPHITNQGKILAKTGSVLLAAGEKITLDFSGDSLMEFTIEGSLEKALISQDGDIEALQGHVMLSMGSVFKVIEGLINVEGISVGKELVEKEGKIFLTEGSEILSKQIIIEGSEGSCLKVEGSLKTEGGSVHLFAEEIILAKGEINTSSSLGGGQILVGGGKQGKGDYYLAKDVTVGCEFSLIANGLEASNGGEIIIWSEDTTIFNGRAFARGGDKKGDGGFVETSGRKVLSVEMGKVDTGAILGERGTWLLDPLQITIAEGNDIPLFSELKDRSDMTSIYRVSPHIIEESNSHVILSALGEGGGISILSPIHMKVEGVGLTLSVSEDFGMISLNNDITTKRGSLRFEGPVSLGEGQVRLLDTALDSKGDGASIFFAGTVDGSCALKLEAGFKGNIQFTDVVGGATPLAGVDILSGARVLLSHDIVTAAGPVHLHIPVALKGNAKIDTTAKGWAPEGASISLEGAVNGTYKLSLDSGSMGSILVGSGAEVGQNTALAVLYMKGSDIAINSNMTASGGTMIFDGPVSIGADLTLTDTGPTGIIFLGPVGSVGGSHSLVLNAPVGRITFLDSVGTLGTPLQNLTATSSNIQIGEDIVLNNQFLMNGPVQLLGDVTITGSTLRFLGTVDGAYDLSLDAGSSGVIVLGNQVGNIARINVLNFINADTITAEGIYADSIIQTAGTSSTFNEFLDTAGVDGISLTGQSFSFGGGIHTQNGGGVLIDNNAIVTFSNSVDVTTAGPFTQTGTGAVSLAGTIVTRGKDITFAGPITLVGAASLSTGNSGAGNITLSKAVDGEYPLSFTLGIGDLTLAGALGSTVPLEDVTIYSARNVVANDISSSSVGQVSGLGTGNYLGNITTTGPLGINLVSTYLTFAGRVGGKVLTTTDGNIVINSIYSAINSDVNPVEIDVNNGVDSTLFVGSSNIGYFSSSTVSLNFLGAVRSNIPCSVKYNGTTFVPENCPTPLVD